MGADTTLPDTGAYVPDTSAAGIDTTGGYDPSAADTSVADPSMGADTTSTAPADPSVPADPNAPVDPTADPNAAPQ